MGLKKSLNKRRLTKKEVQKLVEAEGKLHEEFTYCFEEIYSTGYKKQPLIYELSDDRFLFVFDLKESRIGGKGDIYYKEDFLRLVQWTKKVREDYTNNRGSSVEHWKHYSKNKTELINKIDELINEMVEKLALPRSQLDFSYVSLEIISNKAEEYGLDKVQAELYDNLVAYVGEVLRHRVNGQWAIHALSTDEQYPCIKTKVNGLLMPINVVWQELSGLEPINLRREAVNEVRRFS